MEVGDQKQLDNDEGYNEDVVAVLDEDQKSA